MKDVIQRPGSASSLTTGGIRQGHRGLFKVQLPDFQQLLEILRVERAPGRALQTRVQLLLHLKIFRKRLMI